MKRFSFAGALVVFFAIGGVAHADMLGDSHVFHTESAFDGANSATVPMTLRAIGQNAYFYVDERGWNGLSTAAQNQFLASLNQLAGEFDSNVYPRATAFWGSEPNPGIDGDPRVTILAENLLSGFGGYFSSINEYSAAQAPDSNVREMIAVSFESVLGGYARSFLAHEFQHLISFNQKELLLRVSDDTWLNEARSEYMITVAGYNTPFGGSTLQRRVSNFLRTPSDSLTEWPNTTEDYAITTIFGHYLTDRYGPQILGATIHSPSNGVSSINGWLASQGKTERFGDVFADWMVAARINDSRVGSQYGYTTPGLALLQVPPSQTIAIGQNNSGISSTTLKEWQPSWMQFSVPFDPHAAAVNIQFSGQESTQWVGADIATYADGHHRVFALNASIPTRDNGIALTDVVVAVTHGTDVPADDRQVLSASATITVTLGEIAVPVSTPVPAPTAGIKDGDLIRRPGQAEVYVIWGKYRRYLPQGVLALYGFENRPVVEVPDDVFNRYTTSNYVRAVDGTKVYALWPDATKHWLNITPTQWDASGRDWNAIFIVNNAEVAFYQVGLDITR